MAISITALSTVTAIACSLACAGDVPPQATADPTIELSEIAMYALPSGFRPTGAILDATGAAEVWDGRLRQVLSVDSLWDRSVTVAYSLVESAGILVSIHRDSAVEEIVATDGVYRKQPDNSWHNRVRIDDRKIISAAYTRSRWILLCEGDDDVMSLIAVTDTSESEIKLPGDRIDAQSKAVVFRAGPSTALVVERQHPYRSFVVDRNLDVRQISAGIEHAAAILGSRPGLQVTSMLSVEELFLQVVADPRSDERALTVLDPEGAAVRTRTVDAPIGFLATSRDGRHAVALRGGEIVLYSIVVIRNGTDHSATPNLLGG